MALADSVSGDGKVIDGSTETGSYSYIVGDPETDQKTITVSYTDVRQTLKWYGLALSAITTYISSNPTFNVTYTCTNEVLQSYEMIQVVVTRTITNVTVTAVPEA